MERITRFRAMAMLLAFALLLGAFSVRLYGLQMVDSGDVVKDSDTYTSYYTVKAARGELLDRNGNVLVGNRASYNLVFNNFVLTNADDPNGHLLRLVELCEKLGVEYEENFPVTLTRPYEYTLTEQNAAWQGYFQSYLWALSIDSDISAPRLMQRLREMYKIPEEWTDEQARKVIGLRYELRLRTNITNLPSYIFIEDVSDEILNAILELNVPGLEAQATTTREYNTTYAAHILGTMSIMDPDDWEIYKDKGYQMDDKIGKTGLERAFEEYLHGTDGQLAKTVDKDGNIISQRYTKEPVAGHNVETTIDLRLQIVAEDALANIAKTLQEAGGTGSDVEGMAVVVLEVKTGEVLACASYPTFDLETFNANYNQLMEDPLNPTFNRALMAEYPPGSVYKMVMSIAGLENGLIDRYTEIEDKGVFTKYSGIAPQCLIYTRTGGTHGMLDVVEALRVSCNYFYYVLGDRFGDNWNLVDEVGKGLGLGEHTGIELAEYIGQRANAETKAANHNGSDAYWYSGDQVLASIGQAEHLYTPMQMACYVSAIANKGNRLSATFLNRVVAADYSQLVQENSPKLLSTVEMSNDTYNTIVEGMRQVVESGTAASAFRGFEIPVCGKTGTAEHGRGGTSNGAFVCFAPQNAPEIAIAVYGEKSGSGSNLAKVARAIMEAYFSTDDASDAVTYENRIG